MVKERADGSPQLNLRVPLEHQERVRRVVALLRAVEGFPARLDELMATASDPATPYVLAAILARVERLEAGAKAEPVGKAVARAAIKPAAASDIADSGDSEDADSRDSGDSEGGKKSTRLP